MFRGIAFLVGSLALGGCLSSSPTAPAKFVAKPLVSENAEPGLIRTASATYQPGMVTIHVVVQKADQFQKSFSLSGGVADPGVPWGPPPLPPYSVWGFVVRPASDGENFTPAEGDSFPFYWRATRPDTLPAGFGRWSVQGNRITLSLPIVLVSTSSFFAVSTNTVEPTSPFSRIISIIHRVPIAFH